LKKKINESEVTLEILKKGNGPASQGKIRIKDFIEDNKCKFSILKMCTVLGVSRTTYYRRKKQGLSGTETRIMALKEEIASIFNEHKQTYGSRKITKELHKRGLKSKVHRVMFTCGCLAFTAGLSENISLQLIQITTTRYSLIF
jgi:hypothetical protein